MPHPDVQRVQAVRQGFYIEAPGCGQAALRNTRGNALFRRTSLARGSDREEPHRPKFRHSTNWLHCRKRDANRATCTAQQYLMPQPRECA